MNKNIEQLKKQLKNFFGDRILTFSIKKYENGEWVAECNEIDSIMTGGIDNDIAYMDRMIRDAILTAAGIDSEYASTLLKFVGYNPVDQAQQSNFIFNKQAEYVLS